MRRGTYHNALYGGTYVRSRRLEFAIVRSSSFSYTFDCCRSPTKEIILAKDVGGSSRRKPNARKVGRYEFATLDG